MLLTFCCVFFYACVVFVILFEFLLKFIKAYISEIICTYVQMSILECSLQLKWYSSMP